MATVLALSACSPRESAPPPTENGPSQKDENPPRSEAANAGSIRIGEFSGIALRDGGLDFPNDNKIFGVGKTQAEVAEVLTAAGVSGDKLSLTITPLLVNAGDRTLLFDTGAGVSFGPNGGALTKSMGEAGIGAKRITDIFISHGHGDHVSGLINPSGALAFPNATIHMSAPEWTYLKDMNAETAAGAGLPQHTQLIAAITSKVVTFEPDADVIPGVVKAVAVRGHTPGHSAYLIGSGASSLLYIGDALHHYVISVQRPEWTIAFDRDAPTAEKSRSELLSQSAASGQRIYAIHFPYPGVGKFAARGDRYEWVAE